MLCSHCDKCFSFHLGMLCSHWKLPVHMSVCLSVASLKRTFQIIPISVTLRYGLILRSYYPYFQCQQMFYPINHTLFYFFQSCLVQIVLCPYMQVDVWNISLICSYLTRCLDNLKLQIYKRNMNFQILYQDGQWLNSLVEVSMVFFIFPSKSTTGKNLDFNSHKIQM